MKTVAELMDMWPTVADFGRDIGIKPSHAGVMKTRGVIPVDYWPAVIEAAATRNIEGISADLLMRIHVPAEAEAT